MAPPKDFFGLFPSSVIVFPLMIVCLSVFLISLYVRMIRPILLAQATNRTDRPLTRLFGTILFTFGQRKVLRSVNLVKDRAGLGHFVIFVSFLSLSLSYLIFIFGNTASEGFSNKILGQTGAKIYAVYLDLIIVLLTVAIVAAIIRRRVIQPHRLKFDLTKKKQAYLILLLIASLVITSMASESFYEASGGAESHSYIGNILGTWLSDSFIGRDALFVLYQLSWWVHLLLIFGFALYIPFSKHTHMFGSPLSFYFRQLGAKGELSSIKDFENAESFGAVKVPYFNQKQIIDAFACAVCGRCSEVCPANLTGKALSPMHVVQAMRLHISESSDSAFWKKQYDNGPTIFESGISKEATWDCLTCGACVEVCPVGAEPFHSLIDIRRNLVLEEAEMPDTVESTLLNLEQRGHPWKGTPFTRNSWYEGLDVKTFSENPQAEYLMWVGCTNSLDGRSQNIPRSMVSILNRAEVDFAILGTEETCTGDPAKRLGNEYLFQILAAQNIETFEKYGIRKILASCPHCFNSLKNEYPHLGGKYEVLHYSELMNRLIDEGKIKPLVNISTTMAYHDSCYLGRNNNIYDAPRKLANSIPGLELIEMEQCKGNGFCCGAGGGNMWMEESGSDRVNHRRTDQFLKTGADTIGVSCPFCLQMLEEGIQSKEKQADHRVRDLVELVDESLGEKVQTAGPLDS